MASIVDRVLRRKGATPAKPVPVNGVVAQALAEQLKFEAAHPVPFAADQRRAAILHRCELLSGKPRASFAAIVDLALKET